MTPVLNIAKPYLLFLGDASRDAAAKTGFGLRDWCQGDCLGQWALPSARVDLGLPALDPIEAARLGARSLVIAVAPVGGAIAESWIPCLVAALEAGLDVVSGMHSRLKDVAALATPASRCGRQLIDVRHPRSSFPVATGRKRPGKRALTVGTDCALGKKYTALALAQELKRRGLRADFRATGQTGILISGSGVAIDAVIADFVAGAAESLSPANDPDHWDVIEGQGSLFHPAYAGVTLGLLHGSQPDALVLCHDPLRAHLEGFPEFPLVDLKLAIQGYLAAARLTNPRATFVGVSLNTSRLTADERAKTMARLEQELGLPCADPLVTGMSPIADRVAAL
jgi:uncharacterized NAD-dependent epimerase/dehydratase family protein